MLGDILVRNNIQWQKESQPLCVVNNFDVCTVCRLFDKKKQNGIARSFETF